MIGIAPLFALLLAVAAEPAQRARVVEPLPTLFSDEDYPAAAARNGEQGRVRFRLWIGADGRPSGCSILASSGSSLLDSTTCRLLMERARFTPARDAQGKATTDSYASAILWKMEEARPRLRALQALWTACVIGEASKLAPGGLPGAEVARRAFPPCAALEGLVADEVGETAALEEARGSLTRQIEQELAEIRPVLNAPPETGAPRN